MFFNSHDSSTAADIEIEGGSTQNSWKISSKIHGICSMCTSKDPWVDSYLHNYKGEVLLQWKFNLSKSYECPWNTELVCLWSFPLSSYQFEWQTTLRCYWSTARSNTKNNPSSTCPFHSYSGWFLCPSLGVALYKSISISHPWHCNKVVFSVEQESADDMASLPLCRAGRWPWGYRKLSSTRSEESIPMSSIMSMSSMVSSSLLIKVELLEPVSMALSSDVWELEETNISEIKYGASVAG